MFTTEFYVSKQGKSAVSKSASVRLFTWMFFRDLKALGQNNLQAPPATHRRLMQSQLMRLLLGSVAPISGRSDRKQSCVKTMQGSVLVGSFLKCW